MWVEHHRILIQLLHKTHVHTIRFVVWSFISHKAVYTKTGCTGLAHDTIWWGVECELLGRVSSDGGEDATSSLLLYRPFAMVAMAVH